MKKFFVIPITEWGIKGKSLLLSDLQPVPIVGGLPDYMAKAYQPLHKIINL